MTALALAIIARIGGLFGLKLSEFWAGAIVIALVVAAIGVYSVKLYDAGYASAEEKCEAAALQSQLDAMKADRDNARKAASDATLKLAAIEQASQSDQERTAAYVKELEARPVPSCALTDDDLRGMRSHSGASRNRAGAPARARLLGAGGGTAAKAR